MQIYNILIVSVTLLLASIRTVHADLFNVELRKAYAQCKTAQKACETICKQAVIARKKAAADAEDKTQQCIAEHGQQFPESAIKQKSAGALIDGFAWMPDVTGTYMRPGRGLSYIVDAPGNQDWAKHCKGEARVNPENAQQVKTTLRNSPRVIPRKTMLKLSKIQYYTGRGQTKCVFSKIEVLE